jgi:hypothetical protein
MHQPLALAREYLQLRRPVEAAQFARERLAAEPRDVDAHLILALALLTLRGHVHLRAGEAAEARAAFLKAMRASPGRQDARAGLVEALRATSPIHRVQAELRGALLWAVRQRGLLTVACMAAAAAVASLGMDAPRAAQPFLFAAFAGVAFCMPETGNITLLLHPLGRRVLTRTETGLTLLMLVMLVLAGFLLVAAVRQPGTEGWPIANAMAGAALLTGLAGSLVRRRHLTGRQRWRMAVSVTAFVALTVATWWWLTRC